MSDIYEEFTSKLLELDEGPVRNGGAWTYGHCPAHDDGQNGSLSFKRGDKPGVVVTHCNGNGCDHHEIMEAVGLGHYSSPAGDYPRPSMNGQRPSLEKVDGNKTYWHSYDAEGNLRFTKMRYPKPDGGKGYAIINKAEDYTDPMNEPLFATDRLRDWVHPDLGPSPVVIAEGEKAASELIKCGIPALGTGCGASNTPESGPLAVLEGRRVTLWPDYHDKGREHMRRIGMRLKSLGCEVRWFEWPSPKDGGDAADHPDVMARDWKSISRQLKKESVPFPPPAPSSIAVKLGSVADDVLGSMVLASENDGVLGMPTGLGKLDKMTGGLVKTEATLVAAYTGVGKSLLCGMAALAAAREGHKVLICSSEMHVKEYAKRLGCYLSSVNYFEARKGGTESQRLKVHTAIQALDEYPLHVFMKSGLTPSDIRKRVEALEPDLVIVDHLHTMEPDGRVQGDFDRMGAISGGVSGLKTEYGVAVLSAAQFNKNSNYRRGEDTKVPAPVLSDISGNNKLVADHNTVIAVHRPEQYNDDVSGQDEPVFLRVLKHREGLPGNVECRFVPGQYWLTDYIRMTSPVWYED